MIEIRPTVQSDFLEVCGRVNDKTVRALTVLRDNQPVAIAGVTLEKNISVVFSDIIPGVTAPKMTIWRTAKKLADRIKGWGIPAVTSSATTGKFLESIGLEYIGSAAEGKIYRI